MARIISIDYGGKRTGLAVTDPLQIIATGLAAVESKDLITYLQKYFIAEQVELIIIGMRYTSKMAKAAMIEMGMKKKDRQIKSNVDVIAATIMLQEYLNTPNP